jgi:hypothetical protein
MRDPSLQTHARLSPDRSPLTRLKGSLAAEEGERLLDQRPLGPASGPRPNAAEVAQGGLGRLECGRETEARVITVRPSVSSNEASFKR